MKRTLTILAVLTLILGFTGCTPDRSGKAPAEVQPASAEQIEQTTAAPAAEVIPPPAPAEEASAEQPKQQEGEGKNIEQGGQDPNVSLIIKSDNIVSSKEKEEILNEIDKLLDGVLKNINELEDVDSNELNIQE